MGAVVLWDYTHLVYGCMPWQVSPGQLMPVHCACGGLCGTTSIQRAGVCLDRCQHCADVSALRVQWSMWDRIQDVREQELGTLWRSFIIQALFGFTLNTIPVLVSVLTFGVYVLLGNKLTAAEAFTSLSLFTVHPPVAFAQIHLKSVRVISGDTHL